MPGLNSKTVPYWRVIVPAGLLFALVCQFIATRCGIGMTNDSYLFLEGVPFFLGVGGKSMIEYSVFQAKPPLFSFFLSIVPIAQIHIIFLLIMAISLYLWAKIIDNLLRNAFWKAIAFLSIASFTPFLMVHVYLWTEPLFMLFLAASIWVLQILVKEVKLKNLALFIILGVLLMLTRHVGLYFVLGFSLALLYSREVNYKYALAYLGTGIIVFMLWNFLFMHSGIESRIVTLKSPVSGGTWARLDNIGFFLEAASKWILPNSLPYWLRMGVVITVIGGTSGYLWMLRKNDFFFSVMSLVIIVATYYGLMHVAFRIDPFSAERYIMPIFPISVIIFFMVLEQVANLKHKYCRYLMLVSLLWLLYPAYRTAKNTEFWQVKLCNENSLIEEIAD